MNSQEMVDIKKELLKSLLKQMDGGIVEGMRPTKSSATLIVAKDKPDEESKDDSEIEEIDPNESVDSCSGEEDDIQEKLRKLFSSM